LKCSVVYVEDLCGGGHTGRTYKSTHSGHTNPCRPQSTTDHASGPALNSFVPPHTNSAI